MAKRHIALFLVLLASGAFAQSRIQTRNLKPQAVKVCPCGRHSSETDRLVAKLNALSPMSRNAAITLIESLYKQEQEKQKKRLKVFHKENEI